LLEATGYDPTTGIVHFEYPEISGCGILRCDIGYDSTVVLSNKTISVRSLDADAHFIGAVDRFDVARVNAAGQCSDVNWSGTTDPSDVSLCNAHVGHAAWFENLFAPNTGTFDPGSTMGLSWNHALGDSARVTLELVRAAVNDTTIIVQDLRDSTDYNW